MIYSTINYLVNTLWPSKPENSSTPSVTQIDKSTPKIDTLSKNTFENSNSQLPSINTNHYFSRTYKNMANFKKNIKYQMSLIYTLMRNKLNTTKQPWFSEIEDEKRGITNIVLGGIPLKNRGHIEAFNENEIKAVLSLVEDFEYQKTIFSSPVSKVDWDNVGIKLLRINAKDFLPLELSEIKEAVAFLDNEIEAGNKVYVHCKAGKGRSVTAVCCYLIAKKQMSAKDAIAFVKEKRANINLNKHQIDRIFEFAQDPNNF